MIFPNIKVQPYWLKTLEAAANAPSTAWIDAAQAKKEGEKK